MTDWRELGIDRGWDHQNYVEAYGEEHDSPIDYPARLESDSRYGFGGPEASERVQDRRDFAAGWKLGRSRRKNGMYPDGTRDTEGV